MKPAMISVPLTEETPLLKLLIDPNGVMPISVELDGKEFVFEQLAVIPYQGGLFAVLELTKPKTEPEAGQHFVYQYGQSEDKEMLLLVEDEEVRRAVYREYTEM